MKATTTFAALFVVVCSAAAAIAQAPHAMMISQPQLITPTVGPVLIKSDYLGLSFESHNQRGLKVHSVVPGGAGETIGLEYGDIIIGVEGYYCDTLDQLEQAMRTSYGSIKVTVINVRNGQLVNATMKLGRNGGGHIGPALAYDANLGMSYETLFGGRKKVSTVEPNSIAKKLGLTSGDVILTLQVSNGRYEVTFNDAETGRRYTSWYQTWRP